MKKKIITLFILVILSVGILQICRLYQNDTTNILGYGSIEAREIHVGSRLGGRVAHVDVQEGDLVTAKTVLIRLDSRELEASAKESKAALGSAIARHQELKVGTRSEQIEKAQAMVREQEENLKKLQAGPRREEIEAQEARMNTAQAEYDHAERTYRRVVDNAQQSAITDQQRDDAKRTLEMSRQKLQAEMKNYQLLKAGSRVEDIAMSVARLQQTQAELKQMIAGSRKEELERAEAFIQECDARLQRIQVQLEECIITSPTNCRVEICDLEPGDILAAGQVAVRLIKPDDLWVKIYVSARELNRVQLKQTVMVVAEFSSQREFKSWLLRQIFSLWEEPRAIRQFSGSIVHISSEAEFTPRNVQTTEERGNQVFAVKVKILDPESFLRPGMSVTVEAIPNNTK